MTAFHASAWQIAVAALLPIFFCLLLFLAEAKGPLSRIIRESTGLVGAYFTAISILFGLFAALLASDVWLKTTRPSGRCRPSPMPFTQSPIWRSPCV